MAHTSEHRNSKRFETKVDLYFHFEYDFYTRVKYQLVDLYKNKVLSEKYQGISKNVSTEGLCFSSDKKLEKGAGLNLEVYLPGDARPINLQGTVRWSQKGSDFDHEHKYETGVLLTKINGALVHDTVHFDQNYQIEWSDVLESILGKYHLLVQKRKQDNA